MCVALAGAGCKSRGDAQAAPDPGAIKAQQELVERRDALMKAREDLETQNTKIEADIASVKAAGGDTSDLEKQQKEVQKQLEAQNTNLTSTASDLDKINSKLDAAGGVAAREARVAEREARVADREKAALTQMQRLVDLETKNAEKWKESCSTGGGQTIIQQISPPKSGTYSRKEVDSLVGKAKATMAKKGLVASDLGAQRSLEGEIIKALSEADWTRGYVLADQLSRTVDAIVINRPFIKLKMDRLQARVKGSKVSAATTAQLNSGMNELMLEFGDGNFAAANRKINQLDAIVK